jgi:hypothetical protein
MEPKPEKKRRTPKGTRGVMVDGAMFRWHFTTGRYDWTEPRSTRGVLTLYRPGSHRSATVVVIFPQNGSVTPGDVTEIVRIVRDRWDEKGQGVYKYGSVINVLDLPSPLRVQERKMRVVTDVMEL